MSRSHASICRRRSSGSLTLPWITWMNMGPPSYPLSVQRLRLGGPARTGQLGTDQRELAGVEHAVDVLDALAPGPERQHREQLPVPEGEGTGLAVHRLRD